MRSTSLMAYRALLASGKAKTQAQRLFVELGKGPATRLELEKRTGIRINAVCGRVAELLKAGAAVETRQRKCSVSGETAHELAVAPAIAGPTCDVCAKPLLGSGRFFSLDGVNRCGAHLPPKPKPAPSQPQPPKQDALL